MEVKETLVDTGKPYTELEDIRIFTQDVDEEDLVWHRDKEDRIVEALEVTDWLFQFDNNLPQSITKLFIPKETYHRLIKGTGNLKIRIKKVG